MNLTHPILQAAQERIDAGADKHGKPEDCFGKIAELWMAYLAQYNVSLSKTDVAMMMILLKVARGSSDTPSDDTFVDIAGYAACAGAMNK